MKRLFALVLLILTVKASAQSTFDAKHIIDNMGSTYSWVKLWVEDNGYVFLSHDIKDGTHSYNFNKAGNTDRNAEIVTVQVKNDTINSIMCSTLDEKQYDFLMDGFRALQYKRDKESGSFTTYISDWYPKFNAVSMMDGSGTRADGSKYIVFATGIMRK